MTLLSETIIRSTTELADAYAAWEKIPGTTPEIRTALEKMMNAVADLVLASSMQSLLLFQALDRLARLERPTAPTPVSDLPVDPSAN